MDLVKSGQQRTKKKKRTTTRPEDMNVSAELLSKAQLRNASLGPGAEAKLTDFQEKEQKRQKDLNADYRKIARIHARHTFKFNWRDQPVYFHPDIATLAKMAHAHRALQALGARQVDRVAAGQVFVVLNPNGSSRTSHGCCNVGRGSLVHLCASPLCCKWHTQRCGTQVEKGLGDAS